MLMAAATSSSSSAQTGHAMPQTSKVATAQPVCLIILPSPRAEATSAARSPHQVKESLNPRMSAADYRRSSRWEPPRCARATGCRAFPNIAAAAPSASGDGARFGPQQAAGGEAHGRALDRDREHHHDIGCGEQQGLNLAARESESE